MVYDYSEMKPRLLTDEGQIRFLKVRDKIKRLLKQSGAFRLDKVIAYDSESWFTMACVDRMVEIGELKQHYECKGFAQNNVYGELI